LCSRLTVEALSDAAVCLSICLSHVPSSTVVHLELWLLQDTNRNPQAGSL